MTVEEKRKEIQCYCNTVDYCQKCELYHSYGEYPKYCYCTKDDAIINKNYSIIFGEEPTSTPDIINHPSHYCREGAMESIDEMELIFGKQAVKHFCLCNAWKYRYRASAKNGEEDLKKSDWYIKKYKELIEQDESDEWEFK